MNKTGMICLRTIFVCIVFTVSQNLHGAQVYPEQSLYPSITKSGFAYVELPQGPHKTTIPAPTAPQAYQQYPQFPQYPQYLPPQAYVATPSPQEYPPLALPCEKSTLESPLIAKQCFPSSNPNGSVTVYKETSPLRKRIAAAEALYYNKLNNKPFNYQELDYLERLVKGENLSNESKNDFSEMRENFIRDLEVGSEVLKRMDQRVKRKGKRGSCLGRMFSADDFANAEQFVEDLQATKGTEQLALLQRATKEIKIITHEEMFTIVASFPAADQSAAYDILVPKVFTRMSFYPTSFYSFIMDRVNTKLVAKELTKSGDPFWEGVQGKNPSYKYVQEVLSNARSLSIEQLIKVLKLIPTQPILAKNDKQLIRLRDRVRRFVGYDARYQHRNEWTASDLLLMQVPLNADLLIYALDLANNRIDPESYAELYAIVMEKEKNLRRTIIDIAHNPQKSKLPSPIARGVQAEIIYQMIKNRMIEIEANQ